jgi:preprotein translocase subunit SecA
LQHGTINPMFDFIQRLINPNQHKIDQFKPLVARIGMLESSVKEKNNEELRSYSSHLRDLVHHDLHKLNPKDADYPKKEREILDKFLPQAFALIREAFHRVYEQRSYDEQLMVGILLHRGHSAEQKTGEGKTHAAVHPLYLNSLTGRGAHLITVNDYLARRDAEWMGVVYSLLGVSVGCINSNGKSYIIDAEKVKEIALPLSGEAFRELQFGRGDLLREVSRREAYAADLTYGTNNEFGFDYLRDNMVLSLDDTVQVNKKGEFGVHHFAIVDEVDSILIDEARTPLIISAPAQESNELYHKFAQLTKKLNSEDYELDEKTKNAFLTDLGVKKIEKWLGVENVYADFTLAHHMETALKAQFAYKRDTDYVVKDDQVYIVDEFTGRLMEGRRYSEGLHQALEAKEDMPIQKESQTVATITFQNYFRLYEKLAGMSATILTEAEEFHKIYNLDSVSVPTHKNMVRIDTPDRIYKNQRAKWKAVVDEVAEIHATGRPVLIGTTSVENNELLSQLLRRRQIDHEVLNAKNHQREAEIISMAGHKKAVTVATNMAGRGTDIKLGDGVKELGGLHVIGTERHESRRIDNQLRGRAGRQGDPGSSRFFVSLGDSLMRIFGGSRVASLMDRFNLPDDVPIEHGLISKSIESAQQKVEGYNFDIRKHLVEYDDVMNKQREIIYTRRRKLLSLSFRIDDEAEEFALENEVLQKAEKTMEDFDRFKKDFEAKKTLLGRDHFHQLLHQICLTTMDRYWMQHIDTLDELRTGIGLRGYGQRDPLVEFKNESYQLFERLIHDIDFETVSRLMLVRVEVPEALMRHQPLVKKAVEKHAEVEQFGQASATESGTATPQPHVHAHTAEPPVTFHKSEEEKNISRNDPCPCGSGKKWKNCGLQNTEEHQANMENKHGK